MVYVMEGSSILLSRKTLQDFGCIPPDFLEAGQFQNANLAHMQSSKEARLSLTQERGDQELPYQGNAIKQDIQNLQFGLGQGTKALGEKKAQGHGTDEGGRKGLGGGPKVLSPEQEVGQLLAWC